MQVLRLDHVNISTRRLAESVAFYVDGLGLTRGVRPGQADEPGSEPGGAWLCDAAGAPIVHLRRDDEAPADGSAAIDHFALGCDDHAAFRARLEARRIDFEIADYPQFGIRQIIVHDPNGVKIELNF